MQRSIRWLGLAAASSLLIAACSGSASPIPSTPAATAEATAAPATAPAPSPSAEAVELTYFTFSAAPDHLKDLDAMVSAFEAGHPNIKVKVQTASYDEYFTKLQTAVAGGTAPDTFEMNYENFVTYATAGSLLDITSSTADAASKYYPKAYAVFQQDGKQYGLPATFSNVLLFYNKDLFDAAGVAYPTTDWKWADELAAAKKLTGNGVWGDYQPVSFFEFYKVLAQNGGSFFNADKTAATFNDAKGVEAANWLIDKANKDKVMPTAADMGGQDDTSLFKAGKVAMWHNGIWQFSGLKDATFKWDVQLEPGNVQRANHFFSNAAVVSASTAHPAEAVQWITFLTSAPEAVKIRLDASWELPATSDQSAFAAYLEQTPPDNREAVFDALSDIVVPPVVEQQSQLQDIVGNALQSAQSGQATVQAALDDAVQQVNGLLK